MGCRYCCTEQSFGPKRGSYFVLSLPIWPQLNAATIHQYLSISPLPDLLALLSSVSVSPETSSKAVYALSGLLTHNLPAVKAFGAAGGWAHLRNAIEGLFDSRSMPQSNLACPDSDITVRRKATFLINNLLMPTASVRSASAEASAENQQNLHTPDAPSAPVHANSHAAMVSDPLSTETSAETLQALREQRLLPTLISALTTPTPHGADGENERDLDLEEKIIRFVWPTVSCGCILTFLLALGRLLRTYSFECGGKFSNGEKLELRKFFDTEGGSGEQWGMSAEEIKPLRTAIVS